MAALLALLTLGAVGVNGASAARAAVAPRSPGALAVGPNGTLYVADDNLQEILALGPHGTFRVVAGGGTADTSDLDGGIATKAVLDDPGGMVVSPTGTLYIADMGNHRVLAVSPTGTITTVAGDGGAAVWVPDGTPARHASLDPYAVAVGPEHDLYIAAEEQVLRLNSNGTLSTVLGNDGLAQGFPEAGARAVGTTAGGPSALAFDRAGNLYVACLNAKTLAMVNLDGRVSLPIGPETFYPRGWGGLATTPMGAVVGMEPTSIVKLSPSGQQTVIRFPSLISGERFHGIATFSPDGLAVGRHGVIYTDTAWGDGYTTRSAIAQISPSGSQTHLLWEGRFRDQ